MKKSNSHKQRQRLRALPGRVELEDRIDQVHQWLNLAFDQAEEMTLGDLPMRNLIMARIYRLKRDLKELQDQCLNR